MVLASGAEARDSHGMPLTSRLLGCALITTAACSDRPAMTGTEGTTGSAASTGAEPSSGDVPTGPTVGATDTSATSETAGVTIEPTTASTTGEPVDTTRGPPGTTSTGVDGTTSTGADETTGELPAPACPSPCERGLTHEGDLSIKPGDSTADLVCVTRITGDLLIFGDVDDATLVNLSGLEQVDGLLRIQDNNLLTGLAPFACLREVDGLLLGSLPALVDVSALEGLEKLGRFSMFLTGAPLPKLTGQPLGLHTLELTSHPTLADLDALATWTAGGETLEVTLQDMPALGDVSGLAGLLADPAVAPGIYFHGLPKLPSLAGLESVVTASWMILEDLPLIADLNPLAKLESAGQLGLLGMPLVKSLKGLGKFKTAQWLFLGGCVNGWPESGGMAGLTSLAGLDALTSVEVLAVVNSPKIDSLAGAPALKGVQQGLHLINDPQLVQADVDALVTQLGQPPQEQCFGGWDKCPCIEIIPP